MNGCFDLESLRRMDQEAWEHLYAWIYPKARSQAVYTLAYILPDAVEDTATEAIERLVEKIRSVKSVDELPALVVSITHCIGVDLIRKHRSKKRGGGQVESLEQASDEAGGELGEQGGGGDPAKEVHYTELAKLVQSTMSTMKPQRRALLSDYLLRGMKYSELAVAHGLAIGSVGTTIKRALEGFHNEVGKQPGLAEELQRLLKTSASVLGYLISWA